MEVKILGTSCSKCKRLESKLRDLVVDNNINANVTKVTEYTAEGVANIKIDQKPGFRYISRYRSVGPDPIRWIFEKIGKKYRKAKKEGEENFYDERWLKENCAFTGELWLGHLRYGTHGKNSIENCHPFLSFPYRG